MDLMRQQQQFNFDRIRATTMDSYTKSSFTRRHNSSMAMRRKLPPNLIKLETHKLLKETINFNNFFNKLLDTPEYNLEFNNLVRNINSEFDEFKRTNLDMNYDYFIGGARCWNRFFKDFYDLDIVSPYEKSAIHNTNADLYYFINNKTYVDPIKEKIKELFETLKSQLIEAIKSNIKDKDSNKFDITIEERDCINGYNSLMPAKQLYIKLHINQSDEVINPVKTKSKKRPASSIPPPVSAPISVSAPPPVPISADLKKAAKKEKKDADEKAAQALKAANEQKQLSSARSRADRYAKRSKPIQGGAKLPSLSKIILSVDFYYNDKSTDIQDDLLVKNISKLIEEINPALDLNYLNLFGLYIFLQLAKKKIYIQKGYNIFKIRDIIFDKLILIDEYKISTLKEVANKYYQTFNQTSLFDDSFYTDLKKLYAIADEEIAKIINSMEINIIEKLRPYINKTIKKLNDTIMENNSEIGLFVAGGDALRRYKNDISVTKDIDCKIYVPKRLFTNALKNELNNLIVEELIYLLCFLIQNSANIFSGLTTIYETDKYKIEYILSNEDSSNKYMKNFRYRQIFKDPFPVDLYSLDYRCIINIELKDNLEDPSDNTKISYNYDIAFIDVVLELSDLIIYKENAVLSNEIPISKLEFLLKDLKNTYNSDTSSLLRFIGGKITKDYDRYNSLLELIKNKNFIYSKEPLKIEINQSPQSEDMNELDKKLYVCSYRKIQEGETPDDISLPVLFERRLSADENELYDRYALDIMNEYDKPKEKLLKLYGSYYNKAKIFRKKKIYSYNINELHHSLRGGGESEKELEENEELEKSLYESYNNNANSSEKHIDEKNMKKINNYITDIMSPHNIKLTSSNKDKRYNFYKKLQALLNLQKK